MFFIKFLKYSSALFFTLLFIIVLVVFILVNTLTYTVLNGKYFSSQFDKNISAQNIDTTIDEAITNYQKHYITENTKNEEEFKLANEIVEEYKNTIRKDIDSKWISTELPKLLKGSFSYFTNSEKSLPTIYIKPLTDSVINFYADQISKNGNDGIDSKQKDIMEKLSKRLNDSSKNGSESQDVTQESINIILNDSVFSDLKLSQYSASKIYVKFIERKAGSVNDAQFIEDIMKIIVRDKLGMNYVKDNLDMQLLFKNMYESDTNSVTVLKSSINNIKLYIYLEVLCILLILMLIIYLIIFRFKNFSRIIAYPLVIVGILYMIPKYFSNYIISIVNTNIDSSLNNVNNIDLTYLKKIIDSYINGVLDFILLQGIVLIVIGIILIILSYTLFKKRSDDAEAQIKKKKKVFYLVRTFAIVSLIIIIPFSAINTVKSVKQNLYSINNLSNIQVKNNLIKSIDKTIDSNLSVFMGNDNK
ncbi:MAG: hypothetical protein N2749_03020 [Clostridia bacterium]|nr:hypothetical protein [Clostridia bacterium]